VSDSLLWYRTDTGMDHMTRPLFNIPSIHPVRNIQSIHSSPASPPTPLLLPLLPRACAHSSRRCSRASALVAPAAAPHAHPAAPAAAPAPPLTSSDDADRCRLRKEKRWPSARKPSGLASCYGCSASVLMAEEVAPGYDACCKCTFVMFQIF
jgi:hypothetical protein